MFLSPILKTNESCKRKQQQRISLVYFAAVNWIKCAWYFFLLISCLSFMFALEFTLSTVSRYKKAFDAIEVSHYCNHLSILELRGIQNFQTRQRNNIMCLGRIRFTLWVRGMCLLARSVCWPAMQSVLISSCTIISTLHCYYSTVIILVVYTPLQVLFKQK